MRQSACVSCRWTMVELLQVAVVFMLFNHKFFLDHLVYELAEVRKSGFGLLVRARQRQSGVHPEVLDVLVELVMAMGCTRVSLIAQDVANALVWRLNQGINARLSSYVAKARSARPAYDRAWLRMLALPHEEYGRHSRLVDRASDDQFSAMVGARGSDS